MKGGLSEGEIVVTKGNFKIDSALQIMAKPSMMNPQSGAGGGGHQHDQGTPKAGSAAQMEKTTFQVPAPLAFKLHHLEGSFNELKDAVETRDLKKSKEAYSAFRRKLEAIDATSLTGRPSLTWKDLTMLLGNDALLGSESDTPEGAIRLFETLTDHFGRLKDHFHIDHPALAVKEAKGVPAQFKQQLGKIVDPYLTLQASLAKDDFQSAKTAGKEFGRKIKGVDMKLLEGEAHTAWMQALELLNKGLGEILGSKDITGVRSGFEPLSVGMAQAIAGIGVQRKGPLFELFCPMAFENKGATWLQQDKDVRNPYFGEVMLKCGEVGRQLKGE